jgi:hypothetical protein
MAPARSLLNLCLAGSSPFLTAGGWSAEAKPEVANWCVALRDYDDAFLLGKTGTPPFTVLPCFGPSDDAPSARPPPDFKPHDMPYDPDGEPPQISFRTQSIDGKPRMLVNVTASHDCSATTQAEVWSADWKHYFWQLGEIDVIGFAPDLTPTFRGRVELEERQPEKLLSSADRGLCEAVRSDHVKEVPREMVKDRHLTRGRPWSGRETRSQVEAQSADQ